MDLAGAHDKILLTRHGHVDGIKPERFRGREPLELTAQGRADAVAIAQRIAAAWQPGKIYTSPMGRCIETAPLSPRPAAWPPIPLQSRFATTSTISTTARGNSKHSSKRKRKIQKLFAAWFASPQFVRFPMVRRCRILWREPPMSCAWCCPGIQTTLLCSSGHDSVNRALLMELLDQPLSAYWRVAQNPCCLNEIDVDAGKILVRRINETAHLEA